MTIDEMIAVLQAAKDGRPMKYRAIGCSKWEDTSDPRWNFVHYEYREKSVPIVRPFKNAAEFELHRDRWIIGKVDGMHFRVSEYDDLGVGGGNGYRMRFEDMLGSTGYTFDDGSPFGVVE